MLSKRPFFISKTTQTPQSPKPSPTAKMDNERKARDTPQQCNSRSDSLSWRSDNQQCNSRSDSLSWRSDNRIPANYYYNRPSYWTGSDPYILPSTPAYDNRRDYYCGSAPYAGSSYKPRQPSEEYVHPGPSTHAHNKRPNRVEFDGCITAAAIIIGTTKHLQAVCENYKTIDKSQLEHDRAETLCCMTPELIRKFRTQNESHPQMRNLVTEKMKRTAKLHSRDWEYGLDFVLDHFVKNSCIEKHLTDQLGVLCQIVVPSAESARKFPNIDLTVITGKTGAVDKSMKDTITREVLEETGLNIEKVIASSYQQEARKNLGVQNMPDGFKLGVTRVFVLVVNDGDLLVPPKPVETKKDQPLLHPQSLSSSSPSSSSPSSSSTSSISPFTSSQKIPSSTSFSSSGSECGTGWDSDDEP